MGCLGCEWDEIEFYIYFLKDPDYNIMMMSTFLGLTVPEGQKEEIRMVNGEIVKFKYPQSCRISLHIQGGAAENCNASRHDGRTKS